MNRNERYITEHPEMADLFDVIRNIKSSENVSATITTGSSCCRVVNKLENPRVDIEFFVVNDIDEAYLILQGRKTYSFGLPMNATISRESAKKPDAGIYKIDFAQLGEMYELIFDISMRS